MSEDPAGLKDGTSQNLGRGNFGCGSVCRLSFRNTSLSRSERRHSNATGPNTEISD